MQHVWGLILQVVCVADFLRPKITLIVFWPTQVRVDHHCVSSMDSGLDTVFWNFIIVAANSSVFDTLTLWEKSIHKLVGGVYAIFSTVPIAYSCIFLLK